MNVYVISGTPIALQRHRIKKNINSFESQKDIKRYLAVTIENIHGDRPRYVGPLALDFKFIFPWSHTKNKKINWWCDIDPNIGLLFKLICDVGTGILWDNERSITKLNIIKIYGEQAQTSFTVIELNKEEQNERKKEKKQ